MLPKNIKNNNNISYTSNINKTISLVVNRLLIEITNKVTYLPRNDFFKKLPGNKILEHLAF